MRTRSTWLTLLLALSAGTALGVVACSSDTTEPVVTAPSEEITKLAVEKKVAQLQEEYGWVGEYHTDGLDYIYRELAKDAGKKKHKNPKSEKDDFCKTAAKALKKFHKQARKADVPVPLVDVSLINEVCGDSNSNGNKGKSVVSGTQMSASGGDLSPVALSYMNQVSDAISSATSRSALLNALLGIQNQAVNTLSSEEAGAVVAIVSIAISSMDYWEAHLDEWVALPVLGTPYVKLADPGAGFSPAQGKTLSVKPRTNWWSNPYMKGYLKVLSADAAAGARTLYLSWRLGPIGWDAAAAVALWSSTSMCISLLF